MYQILLVVAKIYFDVIATFDFIYSGRVNNPRDMKGLYTTNVSKSSVLISYVLNFLLFTTSHTKDIHKLSMHIYFY